jgi:hypothetical protein
MRPCHKPSQIIGSGSSACRTRASTQTNCAPRIGFRHVFEGVEQLGVVRRIAFAVGIAGRVDAGRAAEESTASPESSASAGSPEMRAALRALRMAFSTNDKPVSSGSTLLNSPIERNCTDSPSMA